MEKLLDTGMDIVKALDPVVAAFIGGFCVGVFVSVFGYVLVRTSRLFSRG